MTGLTIFITTIVCLAQSQTPVTGSGSNKDYMAYPIRHCDEQSDCLRISMPREEDSCDNQDQRNVCLYWETKPEAKEKNKYESHSRCLKTEESLSHVCPVYSNRGSSKNKLTINWQNGVDNQVCMRVRAGEQACFAVRDWNRYTGSREETFSILTDSGSAVTGKCVQQKNSYCSNRGGVADNLWCFDTPSCHSSTSSTTLTSPAAQTTTQYFTTDKTSREGEAGANQQEFTRAPETTPYQTLTEAAIDTSQQVPTCAGQSKCLRLQGAGANSPCDDQGQREVCIYWQPNKRCSKQKATFSYVCPLQSTVDLNANIRTNNWKSGVNNSVCKTVTGGTWACFALSDSSASRADNNEEPYYTLYSEGSGVTDALCWVSWGYNYCGKTTEHTWCVPTTSC
ncbi:uncharacterized protein [Watersipora subatra]|uniref:uncharacterized protein n=1 Tax=Watersipora subatra TaxID=2589382 RepID=UPI00355B3C69